MNDWSFVSLYAFHSVGETKVVTPKPTQIVFPDKFLSAPLRNCAAMMGRKELDPESSGGIPREVLLRIFTGFRINFLSLRLRPADFAGSKESFPERRSGLVGSYRKPIIAALYNCERKMSLVNIVAPKKLTCGIRSQILLHPLADAGEDIAAGEVYVAGGCR
jgi:hypothetical protein